MPSATAITTLSASSRAWRILWAATAAAIQSASTSAPRIGRAVVEPGAVDEGVRAEHEVDQRRRRVEVAEEHAHAFADADRRFGRVAGEVPDQRAHVAGVAEELIDERRDPQRGADAERDEERLQRPPDGRRAGAAASP